MCRFVAGSFDLPRPTRHRRLRDRPAPATATRRPTQRGKDRRRPPPAGTFASYHARRQCKNRTRDRLARRGVQPSQCDRGGDATLHGPGQIVGYPISDLRGFARGAADAPSALRKSLGAVDFVRRLEEVLIRTCADFAIPTKRIPGLTGVWTDNNSLSFRAEENDSQNRSLESRNLLFAGSTANAAEAKIAAIGIHISRFVTSHGFALNVSTDLSYFNLIIPCGITAKPVTSMQQELGKALDLNAVTESISRNFGTVFSTQMLWVDTLDALLGRAV